jgi:hypothetical protein
MARFVGDKTTNKPRPKNVIDIILKLHSFFGPNEVLLSKAKSRHHNLLIHPHKKLDNGF